MSKIKRAPNNPNQVAEVLGWVNTQREIRKLAPLTALRKGKPGRTNQCPVARSLSDAGMVFCASWGWWYAVAAENNDRELHEVPEIVGDFIRQFDMGIGFREYIDA